MNNNDYNLGGHDAILRRLMMLRLALCAAIVAGLGYLHWGQQQEIAHISVVVLLLLLAGHSALVYFRCRTRQARSEFDVWSFLVIDAAVLLLVVNETGRTANPFIYYLLILITVGATVLSRRACAAFTFSCCAAYTALLWVDVRDHFDHLGSDFQLHLLGMWVNFVGSALLISIALFRFARALRDREAALAEAREASLRNEQLIGIGTLAASTVHALGTPLSTLSILLGDMRNNPAEPTTRQDVSLMLEQIDRCRVTMQKLSLLAQPDMANDEVESVNELHIWLKEHYLLANPRVLPLFRRHHNCSECTLRSNLLLKHALANLIDNAIQAASTMVMVDFKSSSSSLDIVIKNDGEPLPNNVINRWGKPLPSNKSGGLGIGIFLANSTIERFGGTIGVLQQTEGNNTTIITVTLPFAKTSS